MTADDPFTANPSESSPVGSPPGTVYQQSPADRAIEHRMVEVMGTRGLILPRYPLSTVGITIILMVFGLALIFQSDRWGRTPAYGNLLILLPADAWGVTYLVGAALMTAGLVWQTRWVVLLSHAAAFPLLLGWELAFGVRWLTDSGTTVANVVAWGTYTAILLTSARGLSIRTAAP